MKFSDRLAALGFSSYSEYLASPIWATFKNKYRESNRPQRCLVCKSDQIELHHHNYDNLGKELLSDVDPLCRTHHEQVHVILAENNWFVDKTAKVIERIKFERQPVRIQNLRHSRKKKDPSEKAERKRKRLEQLAEDQKTAREYMAREQVRALTFLMKQGITNIHVPLDYVPVVGDPNVARYLKILKKAKDRKPNPEEDVKVRKKAWDAAHSSRDWNDPNFAFRAIVAGLRPNRR